MNKHYRAIEVLRREAQIHRNHLVLVQTKHISHEQGQVELEYAQRLEDAAKVLEEIK